MSTSILFKKRAGEDQPALPSTTIYSKLRKLFPGGKSIHKVVPGGYANIVSGTEFYWLMAVNVNFFGIEEQKVPAKNGF